MTDTGKALTADHAQLGDALATRRYIARFQAITGHLAKVAAAMEAEGRLSRAEVAILGRYIGALTNAFAALGNKYLFAGRAGTPPEKLDFDRHESGFPVFQEILTMAVDAQQAGRHLEHMPSAAALKDDMIRQIVGELTIPTKLQYAMAQRLYYAALAAGDIFWARNDPVALWQSNEGERRNFLIHWAIFDSQVNLPVIYLMDCEDTGRTSLPKDESRWPAAQAHLMAQSFSGLKLLTIAQGFDADFDDLHPKRIRRFHVGPMYSSAYTVQSGPLCEVLAETRAPEGQDWALAWTEEELVSERVRMEKSGWFSSAEREVFTLDPFAGRAAETGATRTERAIIMPERPYQVLAEKNPPGFAGVRKFVVSPNGRVFGYR